MLEYHASRHPASRYRQCEVEVGEVQEEEVRQRQNAHSVGLAGCRSSLLPSVFPMPPHALFLRLSSFSFWQLF